MDRPAFLSRLSSALQSLGGYTVAVVCCLVLLAWTMDLRHLDLNVPIDCSGDALENTMLVQGIITNGWYLHNPQHGAPFTLDMHDFPIGETWQFGVLKLLGMALGSPTLTVNVFFLLSFPITVVTTLFVLRHFGVSYGPAVLASILFAFLPYHIYRNVSHLGLSSYYFVPLGVMVVLWLYRGDSLLLFTDEQEGRTRFHCWHGKTLVAAVILTVIALGDVYYAYFLAFFLGIAGMARSLQVRAWRPMLTAILFIGLLGFVSFANITPTFVYALEHGSNHQAAARSMGETEHFGLRIAQLLMPVTGHRVPLLAWAKERFNAKLVLVTENDMASLGLIGSLGFLVLVGRLLVRNRSEDDNALWPMLSRLNVFAILLGTIGGFSLIIAAALPQIRAYNRLSLFIALFSLFAVALMLDRGYFQWATTGRRKFSAWCLFAVLTVGGVLDEFPAHFPTPGRDALFASDAAFVHHLERSLPAGAMIYQMPYRCHPGDGYDHLRMSIHSTKLRWSYPTMRGRPADYWHKDLAARPVEEMLPRLALVGFEGICVDRGAYPDRAAALEKQLIGLLHVRPSESTEGRFAYYSLAGYVQRLHSDFTTAQLQELEDAALHPVLPLWAHGFMQTAEICPAGGRWCGASGTLNLYNGGTAPRTIRLTLKLRTGFSDPSTLVIGGPLLNRTLTVNDKQGELIELVDVPPGRHAVTFRCDAHCLGGSSHRVFRVEDFQIAPMGQPLPQAGKM